MTIQYCNFICEVKGVGNRAFFMLILWNADDSDLSG